MYTSREQREVLDNIKVREGETKRINCPFCGGTKTFTISNMDGRKVWNCYKNSCRAHGATGVARSLQLVRRKLVDPVITSYKDTTVPLPEVVSMNIADRPDVIYYLEQTHVMSAYQNGLVRIGYAPKENRVLFYMNDNDGAVGRALDDRKPKWKAFGDTTGIFKCGSGPTAVVVEDAASACAVASASPDGEFTGVALLGTNLNPLQKRQLLAFKRLIICLDNDASKKSIVLLRKLEGLVPATVKFLNEDFKWMTHSKILEVLR